MYEAITAHHTRIVSSHLYNLLEIEDELGSDIVNRHIIPLPSAGNREDGLGMSMESCVHFLGKILLSRRSWVPAKNMRQESWRCEWDLYHLCGLHYLPWCEPQLVLAHILTGVLAS